MTEATQGPASALYVWRGFCEGFIPLSGRDVCPFCTTPTEKLDLLNYDSLHADDEVDNLYECPLCGWNYRHAVYVRSETRAPYFWGVERSPLMREFDLNAPEVTLRELGTHLRAQYSDVFSLSWRRFEEVVEDVLKRHGFYTVLTQPTNDGGADILIITDGKIEALVECKKYSATKTIGVEAVRALVGACVDWGTQKAALVTTAKISSTAQGYTMRQGLKGFQIDLVDATRLLKLLQVYKAEMPSLHLLDSNERAGIIEEGRRRIRALSGSIYQSFASLLLRQGLLLEEMEAWGAALQEIKSWRAGLANLDHLPDR